jgi:hypothetical protein
MISRPELGISFESLTSIDPYIEFCAIDLDVIHI